MKKGRLRHRIRIQRPIADEGFDGAGSGEWSLVGECWADVQDMLPSRGERIADGINVAAGPARVHLNYRRDVTSGMRIQVGRNMKDADGAPYWQADRIMQIITVPAEIGSREGLEFMVEDYSPAGNPA